MSTSITCRDTHTVRTTQVNQAQTNPAPQHHLVLVASRFLEVGVSAALGVVVTVTLPVSVPVTLFLFGGFGGRDIVPDVLKDTETHTHYKHTHTHTL